VTRGIANPPGYPATGAIAWQKMEEKDVWLLNWIYDSLNSELPPSHPTEALNSIVQSHVYCRALE